MHNETVQKIPLYITNKQYFSKKSDLYKISFLSFHHSGYCNLIEFDDIWAIWHELPSSSHLSWKMTQNISKNFNSHQLSYSNVFQAHFQSRGRDFAIDRNVLKCSKKPTCAYGGKVKKSQNSLVIFMTFCQIFRSIFKTALDNGSWKCR